jgi:hypothetical protein
VCVWQPGECDRCLLRTTCAYPYVFETTPPPGGTNLRKLEQVPRPYVFEPPTGNRLISPGETFDLRLVLVGRGIDFFPHFLFTLRELGRVGLGPRRGRFEVEEVRAQAPGTERLVYAASDERLVGEAPRITPAELAAGCALAAPAAPRFAVRFVTPARIQAGGAVRATVGFADLVRALLRRLSSLCSFHCGRPLDLDFRGLIARAAEGRTVASNLRWHSQERFSGRQGQWVYMNGAVGEVVFEMPSRESLAPFVPLLAAGEWVHVGKGCVMGLGQYALGVPQ